MGWHVSGDGVVRRCVAASPATCKAKAEDPTTEHFDDKVEAQAYSEKLLTSTFGATATMINKEYDQAMEEAYNSGDIEQWTPEAIDEFLTYEEERFDYGDREEFEEALDELYSAEDIEFWTPETIQEFLEFEENSQLGEEKEF